MLDISAVNFVLNSRSEAMKAASSFPCVLTSDWIDLSICSASVPHKVAVDCCWNNWREFATVFAADWASLDPDSNMEEFPTLEVEAFGTGEVVSSSYWGPRLKSRTEEDLCTGELISSMREELGEPGLFGEESSVKGGLHIVSWGLYLLSDPN